MPADLLGRWHARVDQEGWATAAAVAPVASWRSMALVLERLLLHLDFSSPYATSQTSFSWPVFPPFFRSYTWTQSSAERTETPALVSVPRLTQTVWPTMKLPINGHLRGPAPDASRTTLPPVTVSDREPWPGRPAPRCLDQGRPRGPFLPVIFATGDR